MPQVESDLVHISGPSAIQVPTLWFPVSFDSWKCLRRSNESRLSGGWPRNWRVWIGLPAAASRTSDRPGNALYCIVEIPNFRQPLRKAVQMGLIVYILVGSQIVSDRSSKFPCSNSEDKCWIVVLVVLSTSPQPSAQVLPIHLQIMWGCIIFRDTHTGHFTWYTAPWLISSRTFIVVAGWEAAFCRVINIACQILEHEAALAKTC